MNPALIVIDVQKGIDNSLHWGGNRNNPEAEGNIKLLLAEWREKGYPVFIVQHMSVSSESPFHPSNPGNSLKDFIFVGKGEKLIHKSTANAFLNTALEEDLRRLEVKDVVIVGFVTNNSIESTARMCGELDFETIVVSDGTAAFDKQGVDGTIYPSELVHQMSLSNLDEEYARIRTTRQVLSMIKNKTLSL